MTAIRSLPGFRPHPFPVKSYRHFHNAGAALLTEGCFVLAVFYLLEGGLECCFGGFTGTGIFDCQEIAGKVTKILVMTCLQQLQKPAGIHAGGPY